MTTTIKDGALDQAVASMSRSLAKRLTRRSALSKLGRYSVALSLGAAGSVLLDDELAWAQPGGCQGCSPYGGSGCTSGKCAYDSRWCDYGGYCPSYACRCGAWQAGTCSNGQRLMYGDCCGSCGGGGDCSCSSSFDCSGTGSPCPTCCHQINWYTDPNRQCGNCNAGSPWYIHCRRAFCA